MKESLYRLLDLQEIDNEMDALVQAQKDFPTEIKTLKSEIESAQAQVEEQRNRAQELEKTQRTLERDLEAIKADLKKHQDRLYEVKSNREYDALQHEIEALESRQDEHETAILETIETVENLSSKLEEDEGLFKEAEAERQSRIDELTSQLNSVEKTRKRWERKRSKIESGIERRPLSFYSRIRKAMRGGVAIVMIKKGSCGGCFRQLAPQLRVEMRRFDQVMRCENCGRIMVWTEEEVTA
ncbi:MAG: C4-type zinc ribbon domain-containing protein [bacterium]|nr:C4-type zinc ribbon domain-containing protein [bacterium]